MTLFYCFIHVSITFPQRDVTRILLRERREHLVWIQTKQRPADTISSLPRILTVVKEKGKSDTSCDDKARPFKNQRGCPSGPSRSHQTADEGAKSGRALDSMTRVPRPSLWNNASFNALEISRRHLSLSENFPGDYHPLLDNSPFNLTNLLEVQMSRFLLVERVQQEKHIRMI